MDIFTDLPTELQYIVMEYCKDKDKFDNVISELEDRKDDYIIAGEYLDNYNLDPRFFSKFKLYSGCTYTDYANNIWNQRDKLYKDLKYIFKCEKRKCKRKKIKLSPSRYMNY